MPVISLTDRAVDMIEELTNRAGLPPGSGLRIAGRPGGFGLIMSLAERPVAGDRVVAAARGVVYLDGAAAERLHGQTLDARVNEQGAAFFV